MVSLVALLWADAFSDDKKPTAEKTADLAGELPRIPAKEPKEAVKSFTLAPGFRIELVAREPLIRSPVAMDFDEDGRLYVAEFPEYNLHDDPNFKQKGCIKRLEDTDGDGVYDKATVYVDNLPAPVAVACWDGGVFVGSVPNLLYCKDTDGDGKADIRQVVYVGFDRDKAGEAMLNSFRWGADNRFHVSTSMAGGQITPGDKPTAQPTPIRGRFILFDPATRNFETTSGHGQHGMSMDDWGRTFVCDNSNPIHHIYYDGRYAARNPYLTSPPVAANICDHVAEPNLVRTSAFEPWRVVRTRLRTSGAVKGPTEGGRVGGHFTGTTGVTIYRGDAYPPECRGQAIVGEVSNNLAHRMTLKPKGVGFVASKADEGREFLASSDNWFRPCQFANGPDGCLYVVDIYRELIETVVSIPPEILKHLHPESGVDRGRIWRIVPDNFTRRPAPKLSKMTSVELVALLDHPNGWHRDTASRLLYQRQDTSTIAPLAKLVGEGRTPQGRMHALRALHGLLARKAEMDTSGRVRKGNEIAGDELSGLLKQMTKQVLVALGDSDPNVREVAIRLSESFTDDAAVQAKWALLVNDPDIRVRWQLAFSLGELAGQAGTDALVRLAIKDGADPWFRFAIMTSAAKRSGPLARAFLSDAKYRVMPAGKALLAELATTIGLARRDDDVALLLQGIEALPTGEAALGRELTTTLLAKLPPAARAKLQSGSVQTVLKEMVADARKVAVDSKRSVADRATAARNLRLDAFAQASPLFAQLLDPRQPEEVQKAALDALARYDEDTAGGVILDAWANLSPQVRAAATEAVLSRPAWVNLFFDRIEKGRIKTSEIDPARVALLRKTNDPVIKTRAEKLFAGAGLSKRTEVIAAYKPALERKGDVAKGRAIFRKQCIACHRLEGVGEQIGAELAGIQERGADFLLVNILDPNREVLPKFLSYLAQTESGRTVAGLIQTETATSVTIRRSDGTSETLLRNDLESLRSTGLSFMPEGFEKQIAVDEMADLIAYILATK
ncbi:hypothetical protein FRUB_00881 [Fimbriiglobus ruber]|uniref:Cytochrome c domain-containing protein n=1 Tax=Fimbriiglobus ruber TaxID=1908690 RepID=A0A225E0R9_9BACT|nr:hypothetical protein FRUB_00881 [Fimbriiglobus ruber]